MCEFYLIFSKGLGVKLLGVKGKNDFMAIGGAWSSSLDGENPSDPQTQINTAIRTTRALTGVDLSSCSKWYLALYIFLLQFFVKFSCQKLFINYVSLKNS